ncbi:MAG TPA: BTAD domain-containing putative transcriptional regulator, partial [Acidimicrobiia bacterium]
MSGDGVTEPHRASHRRLLAILALEAGRRIGTERLIDMYWGEDVPAEAKAAIQTHISALRRLTSPDLILTEGYGYRLSTNDLEIDAALFEDEVATARLGAVNRDWGAAHGAAVRALELWRSAPYPDLADDDFARPEIARLEETHLALWELWAESLIALGRPEEALPELERLVLENPYRERLWEHLMTARYQMGRNAEALRAFRQLGDHLAEIGVEPGPSVRRLEEKILLHERDLAAPARNLPAPTTSFVGRDTEMVDVSGLLVGHNLLTLAGAAGSGKTRLAIEVARSLGASYPGGAWFVGLADLSDSELIPLEILKVLGIRPAAGDPLDFAADAIRHESMLLVLDNCEHLGQGVSLVARRLVEAGDGIRILATSREPLHVPGEVVYEVFPLDVPPTEAPSTEVSDFEAVRLFLDRAVAADPHLVFGVDDLEVAARICRRLEGLPLAIELAAAKIRSFPVSTLDRLLRDDFAIAADKKHDSRHSSVEAAIAWSYDLLDETERAVLMALAVFRGGFDLDMARSVAGADVD